ncbi:MAG: hypothetical protein M5U19_12585 [Microthrixaceae bacterium]|nr:hypothetical protein [Microthrixaceae bacterium]
MGDLDDLVAAATGAQPDPQAEGSGPQHRSVRVDALSSLRATAQRRQRRRLADAARELITKVVVTAAGADDLAGVADRLEELCGFLGELPPRGRPTKASPKRPMPGPR